MAIFVDPKTGERFNNDAEDAGSKAAEYGLLPLEQYEKEQRSGGFVDTLQTVPETAVATVAETGAALGRVAGADVQGSDIAPFAFTPEAKERREVNPTAAAVGAALPDVALAAAVPGVGAGATALARGASAVGRAALAGAVAEGGETAITGEPYDFGDAALYGLTAGAIEGVGKAAMTGAMRATGYARDALEATVNRARKFAVADAVAEPDTVIKAAKSVDNAEDLFEFHQTKLDDALTEMEERVTAAPEAAFDVKRLQKTVLDNPVAQTEQFLGLENQLYQAAQVSDSLAVKQARQYLEEAAEASGAKRYAAMRKARQELAQGIAEKESKATAQAAPDIEEAYALNAAKQRLRRVADYTGDADIDALAQGDLNWTPEMNALPASVQKRINTLTGEAELPDVMAWVKDRKALRSAHGRPLPEPPSPLELDALQALDDALANEGVWGRAAKHHRTLNEAGTLGESKSFRVNDLEARGALQERLNHARRVAEATGDEGLLKTVSKAEAAIAASDGVTGAKVMSEAAAAKADFADELAEKLIKKGAAKFANKAVSAAAGFVAGGPLGGFLGNALGDLTTPYVERLATRHKSKLAGAIRTAASKAKQVASAKPADLAARKAGAAVATGPSRIDVSAARLGIAGSTGMALAGDGAPDADGAQPDLLLPPGPEPEEVQRTQAQLEYLRQQSRTTVETTARAVASPIQNARKVPRNPGVTNSAGVAGFIGSSGSLRAAYDEKKAALTRLQEDPMSLVDELADSYAKVEDANPELHRQLVAQTYKVASFLQSKLPGTIGACLARPEGTPPSPLALRQFALFYSAATDPSSVLVDLTHNRAQREQVDTLRELWPETYAKLKQSVLNQMADARPTVSQRQRMDTLFDFGEALDTALSSRLAGTLDEYKQRQAEAGPGGTAANPAMPTRKTQPTVQGVGALGSLSLGANKAA